jgi:hypothetical protein
MTYRYGFEDLKHHGNIYVLDENGDVVGELPVWEVEDFPREDIEEMSFMCRHCVKRFAEKHRDTKVSRKVLEQLGIVVKEEKRDEAVN